MDCEEERAEPRARNGQAGEHPPKEQRGEGVQKDVYEVIAGRVIAPEPPLQPEGCSGQRRVIGGGGTRPDVREAVGPFDQRILGDEQVIVPDETRAHGRNIADGRGQDEAGAEENA